MKVHILDDWFNTLSGLPCFSKLDNHEVTVWTDHLENTEQLSQRLASAEVLVLFRERTKITRQLVQNLSHLKLISQRSNYPHIDVQACTDHQVLLCSNKHSDTPSYAAAELTWALILAAMRELPEQIQSLKQGNWQAGVGKSLRGRTLGLYGYGRIAKVVADYAQAFGMQVLWWASAESRQKAQAEGRLVACSRQAFFQACDIISLHLRLTPETRHLISLEDLDLMSSQALLINTARAGLIAPNALLQALNQGRPGRAAIDVFDTEPMLSADELLNHPRLIATPHIGYVTCDEFELQFSDIFDQINAYQAGKPIHMVNPEVFQKPGNRQNSELLI